MRCEDLNKILWKAFLTILHLASVGVLIPKSPKWTNKIATFLSFNLNDFCEVRQSLTSSNGTRMNQLLPFSCDLSSL